MKIIISPEVLSKYPKVSIGVMLAQITVKKSDEYVENLKNTLPVSAGVQSVKKYPALNQHPTIAAWRNTYKSFNVKPSDYLSSVESLMRRVVKQQPIWSISDIVDLYNCVSVQTVIPMGSYDIERICGDIILRHGKPNDTFVPVGAKPNEAPISVSSSHVVYADDAKVLTWLWNYKDCFEACITEDTKYALFFADIAEPSELNEQVLVPIELLEKHLQHLGSKILLKGILNPQNPIIELGSGVLVLNA